VRLPVPSLFPCAKKLLFSTFLRCLQLCRFASTFTRTGPLSCHNRSSVPPIAPRHMDQIHNLLIDTRRFFQRWGRGHRTIEIGGGCKRLRLCEQLPKKRGSLRRKNMAHFHRLGPSYCRDNRTNA